MDDIYLGNVVRITALFEEKDPDNPDAAGTPTSPTAVVLKILKPDGTLTNDITPTESDDDGYFYYDYTTTMAGKHIVKVTGSGIIVAVDETFFNVKGTAIT